MNDKEREKLIEELDTERASLLANICENEDIYQIELVYNLVMKIRVLTKLINNLKKKFEIDGEK